MFFDARLRTEEAAALYEKVPLLGIKFLQLAVWAGSASAEILTQYPARRRTFRKVH